EVDGGLLGDQSAGARAACGTAGLGVADNPVDALDEHAPGVAVDGDDLSLLGLVLAGEHLDQVALLDLHLVGGLRVGFGHGQSTSGASEMIFMNFFSRSSRPTGPKMRVPRGSPSLLRITAAFSSKRMYEPSARRRSLTGRQKTALNSSPFF